MLYSRIAASIVAYGMAGKYSASSSLSSAYKYENFCVPYLHRIIDYSL